MNKDLLIGVVLGVVAGWFFTKRYYESEFEVLGEDVQEELANIEKGIMNSLDKEVEIRKAKRSINNPKVNKIDRKRPNVNVVENVKDLAPSESPEEYGSEIRLISEDEYNDTCEDYTKTELVYNMESNTLYDACGDPVNFEDCISHEIINNFCEDERAQIIYVRNNILETDYLVDKESFVNPDIYNDLADNYKKAKETIIYERGDE